MITTLLCSATQKQNSLPNQRPDKLAQKYGSCIVNTNRTECKGACSQKDVIAVQAAAVMCQLVRHLTGWTKRSRKHRLILLRFFLVELIFYLFFPKHDECVEFSGGQASWVVRDTWTQRHTDHIWPHVRQVRVFRSHWLYANWAFFITFWLLFFCFFSVFLLAFFIKCTWSCTFSRAHENSNLSPSPRSLLSQCFSFPFIITEAKEPIPISCVFIPLLHLLISSSLCLYFDLRQPVSSQ